MRIKHVVMFMIRDDASYEQVQAVKKGLLDLPKQNQLIKSYELGLDLKLAGGQNHPAGKNRSICWSATFDNVADYEAYEIDPAHVDCINNIIKPAITPGSRAAIQYEL
jgi:hypothetical protein